MNMVIKRYTMHHQQPHGVDLVGSWLLLQFAWKTPTCLQMVANQSAVKHAMQCQVFADQSAFSLHTAGNRSNLLVTKAITTQFLVQDPLCDTSHLATGAITHQPGGRYAFLTRQEVVGRPQTGLQVLVICFVDDTVVSLHSSNHLPRLHIVKIWIQFILSNQIVIKLNPLLWLWKVPDLRLDADSCSKLLCSKVGSVGVTLDLLLIRFLILLFTS